MNIKMDVDKVKRWRQERSWSQEHLAELAGIGLRTLQRAEYGDPMTACRRPVLPWCIIEC